MERQFTATVYIVEQQKVLLIKHRKMKKWLPPGGHIELNETPPEAAIREALEETGLHIEIIPQENVWVNNWNAKSFQRPYLCLLEEVPEYQGAPAHQHMDMIYLGKPIGGTVSHQENEVDGVRWFSLEEIELMEPDVDIYAETQQMVKHLLSPIPSTISC